jgi:hypothetical protein
MERREGAIQKITERFFRSCTKEEEWPASYERAPTANTSKDTDHLQSLHYETPAWA